METTTTEGVQQGVDTSNTQASTNPTGTQQQALDPQLNEFFNGLPDHLKQHKSLSKFDSVDKLADAYVNASKLIGKRISEVKPEELKGVLDHEDLVQVYKGMGVPETPDAYNLPEDMDPEISKFIKTKAHELGLPEDKLNGVLSLELEAAALMKQREQETWRTEVITKYGNDLQPSIKIAQQAVKEFGGDELVNFLNTSGLGDHPAVIDTFVRIGKQMQEDRIPFGRSANAKTSVDIQQEISSLRKDPDFMNKWRNGSKEHAAKIEGLYRRLTELEKG